MPTKTQWLPGVYLVALGLGTCAWSLLGAPTPNGKTMAVAFGLAVVFAGMAVIYRDRPGQFAGFVALAWASMAISALVGGALNPHPVLSDGEGTPDPPVWVSRLIFALGAFGCAAAAAYYARKWMIGRRTGNVPLPPDSRSSSNA